jgi:cytochrome c peroxidase
MSSVFLKRFLLVSFFIFLRTLAFGDDTVLTDKLHQWSKEETDILRSLWIGSLPPLPKDPSNKYSDNQKAARLGEKLFFDKRFSKDGKVACATCHHKNYDFTEAMPRSHGIGTTGRRTQPIIGAAYLSWFFWDGRADSLWSQALGPPENPNEHGISRTLCARIIREHYRAEYEEVFGPLPDFPSDVCPSVARPDTADREAYAAWTSIPPEKAEEINRVYANMGKAIAAYERLIVPGPARFDVYVVALLKNDREKMSETLSIGELEGLRLFIGKAKCVSCHNGPLFTNGEFRRTGVYQPAELPPDVGRADGIKKVLASEFNCLGKYSDAAKDECIKLTSLDTYTKKYNGAFKVPTLRNVGGRAPYMHAGQYWALWEVIRFYSRQKPSPELSEDLDHGVLSDYEMVRLKAFLHSLSGPLMVPDFGGAKDDHDGGHKH